MAIHPILQGCVIFWLMEAIVEKNLPMLLKIGLAAEVQVAKGNERPKFSVIPQRWLVERCLDWLEK